MMLFITIFICLLSVVFSFSLSNYKSSTRIINNKMLMKVENDAWRKEQRSMRKAGADERTIEIRMPLGLELDEDANGNVFVKSIDKGGRAEKTGKVFVGDIIAMASSTFGDDMWSCRGVGLTRVLSTIKVRNTKPVKLVLEAPTGNIHKYINIQSLQITSFLMCMLEQEEKKRRAIAYAEVSAEVKEQNRVVSIHLLFTHIHHHLPLIIQLYYTL